MIGLETHSQKLSRWFWKRWTRRRIYKIEPIRCIPGSRFSVRILTGEENATELLWTVKSLFYFSGCPFDLTIHDDGTLTSQSESQFQRYLPGCKVVRRSLADELMREELKAHPTCLRFRSLPGNGMSLKLFDCLAMAETSYIGIDTDIVFFSKPQCILRGCEREQPFFQDNVRDVYCADAHTFADMHGLTITPALCAGLIWGHRRLLDLDLLEEFLSWALTREKHVGKIEQTAWALLYGTHAPLAIRLPREYGISNRVIDDNSICHHYTGPVRWRLYREGYQRLAQLGMFEPEIN